jgi:ribosome assembly protein 4
VEVSLRGHDRWIKSVSFSPDGSKLASAGYDKKINIWNHNLN